MALLLTLKRIGVFEVAEEAFAFCINWLGKDPVLANALMRVVNTLSVYVVEDHMWTPGFDCEVAAPTARIISKLV